METSPRGYRDDLALVIDAGHPVDARSLEGLIARADRVKRERKSRPDGSALGAQREE